MNRRWLRVVLPAASAVMILLLLCLAYFFRPQSQEEDRIQTVSEWRLDGETVSLPLTLDRLDPRTPLTLTAHVQQSAGDYLYLKTVYAPLRVYVNDRLLYEYGQPGSYPAFLQDPPTKVSLLPLPGGTKAVTLRLEYLSPTQRSTMTLYPVLVGTPGEILSRLISQMGFSLIFSIVLIVLGLLLLLVALVLTRFERTGIAFFWLGLFSICVGIWGFGECNLTGLIIDAPVLLYLMAFLGLFFVAVPLLRFGLVALNVRPVGQTLLRWTCLGLEFAVFGILLAQLLGVADFSRTVYLIHILAPLAFCLFAGTLLWERLRLQNILAGRFLLPTAVVALFALLEVGNFHLFHLNVQKSFFFQLGVLFFMVIVSILCGYFFRDAFLLRAHNQQLSWEMNMLERQMEIQADRYQFLSGNAAQLRQQRHDLKHHIRAIRGCLERGETEQLFAYLDQLNADIPAGSGEVLCELPLVNAVALHYQALARESGASCTIRLDIPRDTGQVKESALCVIIGNLLENAAAACVGMDSPFLRLQSRCCDGILTIAMDNSCAKDLQRTNDGFPSAKPGGGIGLRSIAALVEKYHGGCRFEAANGVFSSSVYLRLDGLP